MRKANGSLYQSKGSWFVALSLGTRTSFKLLTCQTRDEAELRRAVLADIAARLKAGGHLHVATAFCRQAASVPDEVLPRVLALVAGLLRGQERVEVKEDFNSARSGVSSVTFGEFARLWTSNGLAKKYRRRVRVIDHTENILRLNKHVYPVIYRGRAIEHTPLEEFSIEHAEHVLLQDSLPEGSVRHVAQCLNRVLSLAVYPSKVLSRSPFQRGWLPLPNPTKARSYLFPNEEAALMRNTRMPLVRRLFLGFCSREGPRISNVVRLRWRDLTLDGLPDGGGMAVIDETKNGEPICWALDPGTAEALRRWRLLCPSAEWVFPAKAIPRYRRSNEGRPMTVGNIAKHLREGLRQTESAREILFVRSSKRIRLRAHDLRATFITLALRAGRSEDWVRIRTGHTTSQMIARYRREAGTAEEVALGWLVPLHLAIPELAQLAPAPRASHQLSANRRPVPGAERVPDWTMLN